MQAAERTLQEYSLLLGHSHSRSTQQAVCDRCLQPIDDAMYRANVVRLEADVAKAAADRQGAYKQSSTTQVRDTIPERMGNSTYP